ncbi:BRO family protein [Streptomyces thermocoprophilus]|jgi:prophage antirepressor-like protein|uniref:BRO family protein n=1 Tax=Streptomyces thermocoprophilus TaxID=78356 RepID=A0ABV5VK85_9ACTN
MHEHNDMPPNGPAAQRQDAIDVNDFVFAATGARVRRLTLPNGEHWFPAVDLASRLGYANTRQALHMHVSEDLQSTLREIAQGVCTGDTLSKLADHRLQKSMKMVNLQGLIQMVNGCTKPECEPFKRWVSEVIATVQRDGSYSLDPAPVQPPPGGGTAYTMPPDVAEALVRLEERSLRTDEEWAAFQARYLEEQRRGNDLRAAAHEVQAGHLEEHRRGNDLRAASHGVQARFVEEQRRGNDLHEASYRLQARLLEEQRRANDLREATYRVQSSMADALGRLADTLDRVAGRVVTEGAPRDTAEEERPSVTPQQLLALWRTRNLVVTDDVHAVAAYLAPALVRGPVRCRPEEIAARTGLPVERVRDCLRMLLKRGCMRQTDCGEDGAVVYVLP